jgi:hypothetical protein
MPELSREVGVEEEDTHGEEWRRKKGKGEKGKEQRKSMKSISELAAKSIPGVIAMELTKEQLLFIPGVIMVELIKGNR